LTASSGPSRQILLQRGGPNRGSSTFDTARKPALAESAHWMVRTALCVEPRHGRIHVFMPPVAELSDYLVLLAAIEETAAKLQMPVVIEGSPPPHSSWLQHFKITPDPGVIEVNLQPAQSWDQLVSHTT